MQYFDIEKDGKIWREYNRLDKEMRDAEEEARKNPSEANRKASSEAYKRWQEFGEKHKDFLIAHRISS